MQILTLVAIALTIPGIFTALYMHRRAIPPDGMGLTGWAAWCVVLCIIVALWPIVVGYEIKFAWQRSHNG